MERRFYQKCTLFLLIFLFVFISSTIHLQEDKKITFADKPQVQWSKEKPFAVYQNKKYIKAFESFAKASLYARKYKNIYICYFYNKKVIWTNTVKLESQKIINAPIISQMPELARGCEVTSLAMMLQHAGIHVDKLTLAQAIKKDKTPYEEKDGEIYYGYPNVGFVGDMYSFKNMGYGVYHKPIKALAEKYLPRRIIDLTGCNWNDLLYFINRDTPVWVITNGSFKKLSSDYFQRWNTPYGPIDITMKEHSVLITGYDQENVYINNPLKKQRNQKIPMKDFYDSWKQMGRQAIAYIK